MAEPYLSEIRMVPLNFAPQGWALCNGQLLPIDQNTALFSLLGTTYGGDGQTTFALPDLQGRFAIHVGSGLPLGATGGLAAVPLAVNELPAHMHQAMCNSGPADQRGPANGVPALEATGQTATYSSAAANAVMGTTAIGNTGSGNAHENMPPFLVVNFIIALQGIYPSRN